MQRGTIIREGNCWLLRYREKVLVAGKPVWRSKATKLATYGEQYRSQADVEPLARVILDPINAKRVMQQATPESTLLLDSFLQNYLAHSDSTLKPSAAESNRRTYLLIKLHLGDLKLRDAKVADIQGIIDAVAEKELAHTTIKKVKSFLSGAYKWARQTGLIAEDKNPVRDANVRGLGKPAGETHAYALPEIQAMLATLSEPGRTAVLTAALTGLRRCEIQGLRWEDFDGKELRVQRSVWNGYITDTKTAASKGAVPLLPILAEALEEHKARNTGDGFVFHGETFKPLDLQQLAKRRIIPELKAAGLTWYGWHGFRRGLATNLYALGTSDKTIQSILRHADLRTTMAFYVKPQGQQAAMVKLAAALKRSRSAAKEAHRAVR